MPNGHSGGFSILKKDLQRLLNGLTDHAVVGQTVAALINARRLSVPAEGIDSVVLTELLDTFGREEVRVEEQDHAYYIIHLDMESRLGGNPNPEEWIVVRSDSPLFGLLRERHQREQKQTKTGSGHAE